MGRRRTLGYIQNEWTCPNCNTRNKGGTKACENCGSPQPENVQFELGADQKYVTDENQVKAAQAGADIHCGFCGTRNPATADTCSQCGGDLKEGKTRESGRAMQAPPDLPKIVKCNNCGTENPGSNTKCSSCGSALPKVQSAQSGIPQTAKSAEEPAAKKKTNWLLIGGIAAFIAICCIAIGAALLVPTKTVQGTVTNVHWETSVPVEELQAVDYSDEAGSPPSGAYDVSCHNESREVCEQTTVDRGNGYSEVVEECHDETEQYCSYTMDEWRTIQTYTLDGNDLYPVYETPNYSSDQRLGDQSEELTVIFATKDGDETYSPATVSEYQQYTISSTWKLKMNALGGVVDVEP